MERGEMETRRQGDKEGSDHATKPSSLCIAHAQ